jgi:hypothetical protein
MKVWAGPAGGTKIVTSAIVTIANAPSANRSTSAR